MLTLRPYQEIGVRNIQAGINACRDRGDAPRVLYVSPTASGCAGRAGTINTPPCRASSARWCDMAANPETALQARIRLAVAELGAVLWRNNAGKATYARDGREHEVAYGVGKGGADHASINACRAYRKQAAKWNRGRQVEAEA